MITSYLTKNFYINTIIAILIFILDRFSKIYVMNLDKKLIEISQDVDFSELCITSNAEVSYLENSETKVQTTKAEGSKCQVFWKITKDACPKHS